MEICEEILIIYILAWCGAFRMPRGTWMQAGEKEQNWVIDKWGHHEPELWYLRLAGWGVDIKQIQKGINTIPNFFFFWLDVWRNLSQGLAALAPRRIPLKRMEIDQHLTSTSLPHVSMAWAKRFWTCVIRLGGSQLPSSGMEANTAHLPLMLYVLL